MAPFEVTDSGDSGYRVANTLAGTRVRTSIQGPDIDAALNPQNGRENPDFFRPESLPAQKRAPSSDGGGNLDSLTLSASADKDADEIELSPFVISSVSDRAVNLSASAGTPNGELNYDSNQETGGVAGTFVSARNASTFSLHVGDASYRMASEALNRGELPDPAKIRPEEFYNAFDYGDPAPAAAEAVAFRSEQCADAFLQGTNLLRLSLKVPNLGRSQDQALHLTVLLDTSGSMQRADRSSEVRQAFSALANVLKPYDQVTLIGFARTPRLLADRVKGDQAGKLASIVAHTPADGGTNLELALTEAAQLARRRFDSEALNRVVILTDGAANLGEIHAEALGRLVAGLRQDKISFDACAIGVDGASDPLLETLTRQGEGHYYLVNSAEDVDRQLIKGLAGALRPEATDVKLQVKFNPQRVRSYRLLGFDNYRMAEADFRNNRVAGADLAGGQDANALYDVRVNPSGDGELGRVIVRFRQTATGRMIERSWPLPYLVAVPSFDQAPASLRLAGSVNYLAEWLKNDRGAGDVQLNALLPVVDGLRSYFPGNDDVEQFDHTFNQAIAAGAGRQR
ncbi:MAG TPA: von Willebrand factor type A domain-containing protein [Opitutaceae bacterium]